MAATNKPPTTPPTTDSTVLLRCVVLFCPIEGGHPLVALPNCGFPQSLQYYHKDTHQLKHINERNKGQ